MICDCCHSEFSSSHDNPQFNIEMVVITASGGMFGEAVYSYGYSILCRECNHLVWYELIARNQIRFPIPKIAYTSACKTVAERLKSSYSAAAEAGSPPKEVVQIQVECGECSICFDSLHRKDVAFLTCGHFFCFKCIENWRSRKSENSSCPICRQPITSPIVVKMAWVVGKKLPEKVRYPIEKGMPGWHDTAKCENCRKPFDFCSFTFRYHCRRCGRCLCGNCVTTQKFYDKKEHYICRICPSC